jgi:hypothetical protein
VRGSAEERLGVVALPVPRGRAGEGLTTTLVIAKLKPS